LNSEIPRNNTPWFKSYITEITTRLCYRDHELTAAYCDIHMEEIGWWLYWERWVHCEVRTEYFCIMQVHFRFQRVSDNFMEL